MKFFSFYDWETINEIIIGSRSENFLSKKNKIAQVA